MVSRRSIYKSQVLTLAIARCERHWTATHASRISYHQACNDASTITSYDCIGLGVLISRMHVVFSSSTENGVQACPHMDFLSYFFRLLLNSRFGLWLILYVFIFCYFLVLFLLHFSFLLG